MWPFRRSPRVMPSLTNATYARWLRAGRPELRWFAGLDEIEQEQLAILGDDYVRDVALAIGYAVADPGRAEAGAAAATGDQEAEAGLAQSLAAEFARRLVTRDARKPMETPETRFPGPSMAGAGSRKGEQIEAVGPRPRLWGRPPDHGDLPRPQQEPGP